MLMRRFVVLILASGLLLLAACGTPGASIPLADAGRAPALAAGAPSLDKLPLYFVENRGQTDPRVSFYAPGKDNTIYFSPGGLTFAFTSEATPSAAARGLAPRAGEAALPRLGGVDTAASPAGQRWAVKLDFVGANLSVPPLGEDKTAAVFSYFKGQPTDWQAGLPSFAQLRYHELWPGVDLVYAGQGQQMKYEFVVQPGADPAQIQLAYRGASAVRLTADGQLAVTTPLGGFHDAPPVGYQVRAGRRVPVDMHYWLDASQAPRYRYGFHLGTYDAALPLVLDPAVIAYAGYIGGAGGLEFGYGIALDGQGNAYVAGETNAAQNTFPVKVGPDLNYNGGYDGFVAKVNAAGTALVYAGYIGGSGDDLCTAIAVDSHGNAYVTGQSGSDQNSFPVNIGPVLTYHGNGDAFVAKVNSAGTGLDYAGYIGGVSWDFGTGIAVDSHDNAYVVGSTTSNQTDFASNHFPVTVGPDLTYNGGTELYGDAFVARVNAAGTGFDYAGYIGGAGDDRGYGIAVDSLGSAYVTGVTASDQTTFPVKVGPALNYNGGTFYGDAFVAKVSASGAGLDYAGYIGGANDEFGYAIALDTNRNAYVTGYTESNQNTFPVKVGPDLIYNGGRDAFVAKVNAAGSALVFAGYIGGAGKDVGNGIAVDSGDNIYVTGYTSSTQTTFPVMNGPDPTYNGGPIDAFVTKVNPGGTALLYSGFIGGAGGDEGNAIAVDAAGNAYIMGDTNSTQASFPVTVGPDLSYNGGLTDAFVAKVSFSLGVLPDHIYLPLVRR